jgi:cyclase
VLAKRVIPTMLVRGSTLVKGERFLGDRSIGHVQQAARVHARRGVDELMILDIGSTKEGRGPDLKMVSDLAAECYIPITVGGGVRSIDDIDALLRAGADKVAICTGAVEVAGLVERAADRFGRQAIVVVIEHSDTKPIKRARCWRNGEAWIACEDPHAALLAVKQAEDAGAGEIVLQSVDRDGTMEGYDLETIREAAKLVNVPLIASGGCSGYEDMTNALLAGADAVAAGALFAFTDCTPKGAVNFLKEQGVCVRC